MVSGITYEGVNDVWWVEVIILMAGDVRLIGANY